MVPIARVLFFEVGKALVKLVYYKHVMNPWGLPKQSTRTLLNFKLERRTAKIEAWFTPVR